MTTKELSQLFYIRREIEQDIDRLSRLRARISSPRSPQYGDMPKNHFHENTLETYMAEIVELENAIKDKITRSIKEQYRLEKYIAEIPDSLTRQIFRLRFVNGLPWIQIAISVGGGNTEDGVRQRVYRHIKKEAEEK